MQSTILFLHEQVLKRIVIYLSSKKRAQTHTLYAVHQIHWYLAMISITEYISYIDTA